MCCSANTVNQMERFLAGLFDLPPNESTSLTDRRDRKETQRAIEAVLNGERWVELPPASSYIRRLQHQMATPGRVGLPFLRQRTQPPRADIQRINVYYT